MLRTHAIALIASGLWTLSACRSDAERGDLSGVPEYKVEATQVVVSLESGLLAGPVGLAVHPSGTVYVLDRMERHVLALSPDGDILGSFGRAGSGPGEFNQPRAIGVAADRLFVFDVASRSIQEFSPDGAYVTGRPVEMVGAPLSYAFAPDGRFAYTSFPAADTGLVRILDTSGREVGLAGHNVSDEPMQPETLLQQVQRREIPGFMRNRTLPMFAEDGSLWLFLQSEGVLQRFGPEGSLETESTVRVPEMADIEDDFFGWYAELRSLESVRFLDYLDAAVVVRDAPWLLWKVSLTREALITVHDREGNITARLIISGAEAEVAAADPARPPPFRRFAVDIPRQRLYLVDDQSATLRSASIPGELLRR